MNLLVNKPIVSHAGMELLFKIECDALTNEDLDTIAAIIARKFKFREVIGIPRGGNRLAKALEPYKHRNGCLLVVDDVYTTGKSLEEYRKKYGEVGVIYLVIFARGPEAAPEWLKALFQLAEWAAP